MPRGAAQRDTEVPSFFLYGEPRREIGPRFLHLEPLEDRSRPNDWNIRAHTHANLNHVFFIQEGSGVLLADGETMRFEAPCILLIPARTVHGFTYTPTAAGWVLTIADAYWRELVAREPGFAALFAAPLSLPVAGEMDALGRLRILAQELVWNAPGYTAAIEGHLLCVLVTVLRFLHHAAQPGFTAASRSTALVARFRDFIEIHYAAGLSLSRYVALLRVTEAQLRRACVQVARQAPMLMVQDRIFLEAQRVLLYTNMTVGEAAHDLGFSDSAYFSRFFAKRAGRSPRAFRQQAGAGRDA